MFRGVNSIKFNQRFRDDNDCLIYLSDIKRDGGYECKRCGNENFPKAKSPTTGGARDVIMTKAPRWGLCSKSLSSLF